MRPIVSTFTDSTVEQWDRTVTPGQRTVWVNLEPFLAQKKWGLSGRGGSRPKVLGDRKGKRLDCAPLTSIRPRIY